MHTAAYTFVAETVGALPSRRRVLEIGGRVINGSIRPLFNRASYTSIDIVDGPGVDIVADGGKYFPDEAPDTVVCCEVLEHAPNAEEIVKNAVQIMAPGGVLILTCATEGRAPHSGHDGQDVKPGEYYKNVLGQDVMRWLSQAGIKNAMAESHPDRGDLYVTAHKPGVATPGLRVQLIHPGADWSTADVYNGYAKAFRELGHEVGTYNLNVRLARASEWLAWNWRRAGRPEPKYTQGDAVYLAGCDAVTAAIRGNVDWVIIFTGAYLHPDIYILLRRAGRKIALIMTESPYEDEKQAKILPLVDVAFTNERTSVAALRASNPNVYYLPPAYDPAQHHPDDGSGMAVPTHDVVFVGTGFQERLDALGAVNWDGIDLGLYGTYELMGSRSRLRKYIKGGVVSNEVAAALYRKAKIGLNLYRRSKIYSKSPPYIEGAESVNPRAIELAACGVFTISDYRAEAAETFGELIPTFNRPEELEGVIRHWLADDRGREEAARALPGRLQASTFRHRVEKLGPFLRAIQGELDGAATGKGGA